MDAADSVDLAGLVEDVEHVILRVGADAGGVAEVMAAARRTERVVTVLGLGDAASSVLLALEGYVAERGGTVDEARRVSVVVGGDDMAGVAGGGVRRVVVRDLRELADALNARWDAQWCATRQFCC